jgi:hypothetical protein
MNSDRSDELSSGRHEQGYFSHEPINRFITGLILLVFPSVLLLSFLTRREDIISADRKDAR